MNHKEKFLDRFNEGNNPGEVRDGDAPRRPLSRYERETPHQRQDGIAQHGMDRVDDIINKAKQKIAQRRAELNRKS
jgi:hypothetical protein